MEVLPGNAAAAPPAQPETKAAMGESQKVSGLGGEGMEVERPPVSGIAAASGWSGVRAGVPSRRSGQS